MRRAAQRTAVWRSALAVVVILLAVACSDDDPAPRSTASIPQGTTPPTTANPDPYAVPPVIDEAYLNKVLAALDAAAGDALRSSMRERVLTAESLELLKAVYSGESLSEQVNALQASAEEGFRGYRVNPGVVRTKVNEIISSGPTCAFFSVERNYEEVARTPESNLPQQYVALRRLTADSPPSERNPTPWTVFYDGFQENLSQPPDPCTSPS